VTRLLQFTDLHWFADAATDYRGCDTRRSFARVLDAAAPRLPADALLLSGDLVDDGSPAGYAALADLLAPLGIPALCIPGNHDAPTALAALSGRAHMRVGGQHRLGRWLVCLLNSFIADDARGRIDAAQLGALDRALAREERDPQSRHALVALHHHPLPVGSRWLDGVALQDPDALWGVLEKHANVRAVVFGHVHQEFDVARGPIRVLGTPSTCVQFLARSDDFALDPSLGPGFRWFELGDDGALATGVVRAAAG
jgi:Icc protein